MPTTRQKKAIEKETGRLTAQQELFCRFYATNSELFSNATLSYAEAYQYKLDALDRTPVYDEDGKTVIEQSEYDLAYATCAANASRLLKNDKIQKRVLALLNEMLRDDVVDAQLAKVILQDYKLSSKISAIREYNALKQRVKNKFELDFSEDVKKALEKLSSILP